ncbi:MAG: NUDIX hydrolase [Bacillota bacterium]
MPRKPKNILVIPYFLNDGDILYALFKRSDLDCWQGIAGGVEEGENIVEAVKRECYEEAGISYDSSFIKLDSKASIPRECFKEDWNDKIFVVNEYSFGVEVKNQELKLSSEHKNYDWFSYDDAMDKLKWDSNKTALWELHKRLKT